MVTGASGQPPHVRDKKFGRRLRKEHVEKTWFRPRQDEIYFEAEMGPAFRGVWTEIVRLCACDFLCARGCPTKDRNHFRRNSPNGRSRAPCVGQGFWNVFLDRSYVPLMTDGGRMISSSRAGASRHRAGAVIRRLKRRAPSGKPRSLGPRRKVNVDEGARGFCRPSEGPAGKAAGDSTRRDGAGPREQNRQRPARR